MGAYSICWNPLFNRFTQCPETMILTSQHWGTASGLTIRNNHYRHEPGRLMSISANVCRQWFWPASHAFRIVHLAGSRQHIHAWTEPRHHVGKRVLTFKTDLQFTTSVRPRRAAERGFLMGFPYLEKRAQFWRGFATDHAEKLPEDTFRRTKTRNNA